MCFTVILIFLVFLIIILRIVYSNISVDNGKPTRIVKIKYQNCKLIRCDIKRHLNDNLYEHNDTKYKNDYNKNAFKIVVEYESMKYESVPFEIPKNDLLFILKSTKFVYLEFYKNGLSRIILKKENFE